MTNDEQAAKTREDFEQQCFEDWMKEVDKWLDKKCGLASSDLPDICYRDMFDAGESHVDAARAALSEVIGE